VVGEKMGIVELKDFGSRQHSILKSRLEFLVFDSFAALGFAFPRLQFEASEIGT
jgi:hypothetical protein